MTDIDQRTEAANIKNANLQYLYEHLNKTATKSSLHSSNQQKLLLQQQPTSPKAQNTTQSRSHHINHLFCLKNKLYNLNEQTSKHFMSHTNRFEDLYDSAYSSFNNRTSRNDFCKLNDLENNVKRRSTHLFNL